MPDISERQAAILSRTEAQGFVTIEQLAAEFDVSTQTIRRDIIHLNAMGLLQRFHGGAGTAPNGAQVRLGHGQKTGIDMPAKTRIAELALTRIPDGSALFIDVGTTMEVVAGALNAREGLSVFTNNIRVAAALDCERHEVRVLGGQVTGRDGSLTGDTIVMGLAELSLDIALIGCSAIERSGRVMDFDFGKVAVKKCAMRAAERSFLLAASSKFGRSARCEIAPLHAFDAVLSDLEAPDPN